MSCPTVYTITVYSWSYWCHVSLSTLLQYIVDPIDFLYYCLHYYSILLILLMSCITVYIITVYSWSYWCPVSLSISLQYIVDPIDVLCHCLHHYCIDLILLMSCITVSMIIVCSWCIRFSQCCSSHDPNRSSFQMGCFTKLFLMSRGLYIKTMSLYIRKVTSQYRFKHSIQYIWTGR
jgi:hypothetical protein